MLRVGLLSLVRQAERVVDLPEPVGPVTRMMPYLRKMSFSRISRPRVEAQMLELEHGVVLLEDTHHAAFAEAGRHGREADVDVLAGDLDLDAAVLRHALLGDVQGAHDLDAGGDGRVGLLGLPDNVVEHAVDPEADDELLFERLDVDVGCLFLDGAEDQRVDELDDRRVVLGGLEDVDGALEVILLLEVAFDLLDEVGGVALVDAVDGVLDAHAGAHDEADRHPREHAKVVDHRLVEGIRDGDDEDLASASALWRSGALPWSWRS